MDLAARLEYNALANRQSPTQQMPAKVVPPGGREASIIPAAIAAPVLTPSAQAPGNSPSVPAASGSQAPAAQSPPLEKQNRPDKEDFQVLIPAFVTSQLKEAFEVGFLLFVPFIVVDMVIANILLAMGMQMLSPTVISLPFKLLLFVLVDGWFLIVRGLVLSYT